jgi:hypothetical protein
MSKDSKDERWKPVSGFEGIYEVSQYGRVRSLDRKVECDYTDRWGNHVSEQFQPGKILSPRTNGTGYIQYNLRRSTGLEDGQDELHTAHSLVMAHFGAPKPGDGYIINHIDGDRKNNYIDNLEWVKQYENMLHARILESVSDRGIEETREMVNSWLDQMG